MRIKLIVSVVVLLIWSNAFAQDANDKKAFTAATKGIVGEWVNELGSPLKITSIDLSSGQISGIYKSSSGTSGKSYPLIGWVNYQLVTGFGAEKVEADDAGADDFISKPFDMEDLALRLKSAIRIEHLSDPAERLLSYMDELDKNRQN